MPIHQFEGFYLGVFSDLDPTETNLATENASALVGLTIGSAATPLYQGISILGVDDANSDGVIAENDQGQAAEQVIFGGVGQTLDSVTDYAVTVTFIHGTVATTHMEILQDTSGRVFLVPYKTGDAANLVLDDYPIESIRLDAVVGNNFNATPSDPEPDAFITCFRRGSMIETSAGAVDVVRLKIGDLVHTADSGPQPIRWIDKEHTIATGKSASVRIAVNALGPNMPDRPIYLSRQHRVLIRSTIAGRVAGAQEVLVAAKDLVGMPGITLEETGADVTYVHILLPVHHLITAHNMLSESLLPGPMVLDRLPIKVRAGLAIPAYDIARPARLILRGRKCRSLLQRHLKNGKPLVTPPQNAVRQQPAPVR